MKSLLVILLFSISSCTTSYQKEVGTGLISLSYSCEYLVSKEFKIEPGSVFLVSDTLDLKGKRLKMPKDVTIVFKKGIIKNGVLIGENTRIEYKNRIFDKVKIEGTWLVPCVKTSMFCDLNYANSLRDVFALTNPSINNTILVEKGNYYINLTHNAEAGLVINDKTHVKIEGNVHLVQNEYPNYSIISAIGKDITIEGHGKILGDRYNHVGVGGEWGMGIIVSGQNIILKDISVQNCWGDCLYVTGDSRDILINHCSLSGGRRQGISVISADGITIKNCVITNIGGTDPGYAIDIEPNENDRVGTVVVEKTNCYNCAGGFTANGRAKNSKVDTVLIRNCIFKAKGKPAVISTTCTSITINKCQIAQEVGNKTIAFDHIGDLNITRNSFVYQDSLKLRIDKKVKGFLNMESWPIIIRDCNNLIIK